MYDICFLYFKYCFVWLNMYVLLGNNRIEYLFFFYFLLNIGLMYLYKYMIVDGVFIEYLVYMYNDVVFYYVY